MLSLIHIAVRHASSLNQTAFSRWSRVPSIGEFQRRNFIHLRYFQATNNRWRLSRPRQKYRSSDVTSVQTRDSSRRHSRALTRNGEAAKSRCSAYSSNKRSRYCAVILSNALLLLSAVAAPNYENATSLHSSIDMRNIGITANPCTQSQLIDTTGSALTNQRDPRQIMSTHWSQDQSTQKLRHRDFCANDEIPRFNTQLDINGIADATTYDVVSLTNTQALASNQQSRDLNRSVATGTSNNATRTQLTLAECILLALQNNRDLASGRLDQLTGEFSRQDAEDEFRLDPFVQRYGSA